MPKQESTPEPLPALIAWPVRAIAVVVFVPLRLLWELLRFTGRFLDSRLVRPVARIVGRYVLRPLGWVLRHLIWLPSRWLIRYLVVVPLTFLLDRLAPLTRLLSRGLTWLIVLLAPPLLWLGRVLLRVAAEAWRAVVWASALLYRFFLRPLGIAVGWIWRYTAAPVARATGWVWRGTLMASTRWAWGSIIAPAGRWARREVVTPVRRTILRVFGPN